MKKIRIVGGNVLKGHVPISGAKNAALKIMATCLLSDKPIVLHNIPDLADVFQMNELLRHIGVECIFNHGKLHLHAKDIKTTTAPYSIVKKMRASFVVLGPLLAKFKQAKVSLPGGCVLGTRPVDVHIEGLRAMGADIALEDGYVVAKAPQGLHGAHIPLSFPSWTGTENILMAATLAKGETVITNAAREPEIIDLANCLRSMGAKIEGDGTDRIVVQGVDVLGGCIHHVLPDRVEAGTYACLAAMTCGDLTLSPVIPEHLDTLIHLLEFSGADVSYPNANALRIQAKDRLKSMDITTAPYPGFATDLQAQWMAAMTTAQGASLITENLFENRFMHVPELCRLGANIHVQGNSALVRGVEILKGAQVMATDIRASVSLVMAALVAQGETWLDRIYHIDRGYEKIEEKLQVVGANIERIQAVSDDVATLKTTA
jgi:UDP-N-acetylglucosamine 1-carboxyvinyltransferase